MKPGPAGFRGILVAGALGAMIASGFAFKAGANNAQMRAAPTSVAIVDLVRLFQNLDEMRERNEEVGREAQRLREDLQNRQRQIQSRMEDLESMNLSGPERDDRILDLRMREGELGAREQGYTALIERQEMRIILDMYPKIGAAIREISGERGYDLVLLDDRSRQVPRIDRGAQAISDALLKDKRILYANDAIDITEAVATRMNNNHAAGR